MVIVAAGCAALTILSFVITRNSGPAIEGIANALIGLGAIALTRVMGDAARVCLQKWRSLIGRP